MNSSLPLISIVTPSLNQAAFLEETILSVLGQGYSNLEYVVIDGGSNDGSTEIIRKYEDELAYWSTERDENHYDAVNKGFSRTRGEIMAWINSDDKYLPWTFSVVSELFRTFPKIEWLTSAYLMHWDGRGRAVNCRFVGGFNRKTFLMGANLPSGKFHVGSWIQQESTFWRRSLWERAGGALDVKSVAADFDLWGRFFAHAELYTVATPLGGFRVHGDQISVRRYDEYIASGKRILQRCGGQRPSVFFELLKFGLHSCFGGRPLNRLPRSLAAALAAAGIIHPTPICQWRSNGWKIDRNYVF